MTRYVIKWVGRINATSVVDAGSPKEAGNLALEGLDTGFEREYDQPDWSIRAICEIPSGDEDEDKQQE